MEHDWLEDGEQIAGSWSVYTGGQGPNAAKTAGKLHVTERYVHFEGRLALQENAAAEIGRASEGLSYIQPFKISDTHVRIPLSDIAGVSILKTFLILKSLQITLRSGGQLVVHFGAASPRKAYEAIVAAAHCSPAN